MEPKVIYLLLALHTALSVKYGANVQKKSDSTSDMRSQKMLIRKNYSEKLYEKELTKLQTDIELYKQKIKTRQNERKILENKILRRMPQKCKKINCPLDERPVCAKFFYKNRNSPPFYVSMINECEINYMKCHRGLESTIVPMENCHSVIGNLYLSDQSEKKRSKRSVKAEKLHGEQFFEENIGKEKMFTLDMFWKANAQQLDQVVNAELNNDGSSIQGSIEIDDDFINVNKVVPQKPKDDDLIDLNKNENQNSSENIELTIETDDADLEKTLGNENVPESEYDSPEIKGTIEIDDKDLNLNHGTNGNEQEENKFDKEVVFNGELKSKYSNLVSKEDFIAGEIELDDENNKLNPKNPVDPGEIKSDESNPKQHLQEIEDQETEELPLVEEPIVDEFEPFHEEEEYHYEPEAMPPIVILDADQRDKKENENVKNSKPPVGGDNPLIVPPKTGNADGSIGDAGGGIIDAKNNENNNKNIGGDDAPGGDEPIPFPDDKNNGDDEVDMEEYNAECPRQCPARDMMVCALCQHGIYKTFLSICHMRMYQCQGNTHEQLELVSRFPCVMSAPLITEDPPMQPVGRVSEPNDQDRVLRYVRCREKGLLGKSPKCTFEDTENINQEIIVTEVSPVEY